MTATGNRPRRHARTLVTLAAPFVVGLVVAACGGGGGSPGIANVGTSGKSHNPGKSPDGSNANNAGLGSGSPSSPGGGHGQIGVEMKPVGASAAQELRYAKCMRANGEPNFPDPNSQGAFSFGSAQGIDPNSTQFQAAQSKCGKDLPHRASPQHSSSRTMHAC